MSNRSKADSVVLITGSRKGIGRQLTEHYLDLGWQVWGCSRSETDLQHPSYRHFCLDVADETGIRNLFSELRSSKKNLYALINNAGIASMNHALLTPKKTLERVFQTNVYGVFLLCREAGKVMQKQKFGRIVNFATVATPLKLEGEAVYAASKAAVISLTQILSREFSTFGVTVNAVGPTPIDTDLIRGVPSEKIDNLIKRQAIQRLGEFRDVRNVVDFFIQEESDFITGQTVFLGGV